MGSGQAQSILLEPQIKAIPPAQGHRHLLGELFGSDPLGYAYLPDDEDRGQRHHRHWKAHPEQSLQVWLGVRM